MRLKLRLRSAPGLVCLLGVVFFRFANGSVVLPYETSNQLVAAKLQKGLESIELYEEALPLALRKDGEQQLTFALGGAQYSCVLDNTPPKPPKPEIDITSDEDIVKPFKDLCMVLPQSWWSYEWCFRKEIRQFHLEHPPGGGEAVRDPEWSLGYYNHSVIYRQHDDNENPNAPITRIHDYYVGGQLCDETGEPRNVEVQMKCCTTKANRAAKQQQRPAGMVELVHITSIAEPKLCNYRMMVCTDRLCDTTPQQRITRLTDLLREMNDTCLLRQEDWWTYELCIGKSIRQYHVEMEKDEKGRPKTAVKSEYVLGTAPLELYEDEEALRSRLTTRKRDDGVPVLQLEFSHGTPCGAEAPVDRSTTVEISCGQRESFVDVIEDRTCHYRVKMTSPLVCEHPEFEPKQKPIKSVRCTKSQAQQDPRAQETNRVDNTAAANAAAAAASEPSPVKAAERPT